MKNSAACLAGLLTIAVSATVHAQFEPYASRHDYTDVPTLFRPRGVFELQGGVGGFTGNMARLTYAGVSWQVRAGIELFPWLALSANYSGLGVGSAADTAGADTQIVNNAAYADLRLIAPLGIVRPYLFVGAGYNWMSVLNAAQNSPLRSAATPIVPIGIGVNFRLSRQFFIGAEATFERNVNDATLTPSSPESGRGDTWNAVLSFAYRTW